MSRGDRLARLFAGMAVCFMFACGGDDDGGDVTIADGGGSEADAGAGGDGGASATAENLGTTCSEENQCPNEGEGCLVSAGAETGFCSLPCQGIEDSETCTNGYAGPGLAGCFVPLQNQDGSSAGFACGVICEGPDEMCPADVCDGTCPGELDCTVSAGSPEVSICQPPGTGGGTDAGTGTDASVGPSGSRAIGVSQAALRMLRARR
jgi:hypothetical protein